MMQRFKISPGHSKELKKYGICPDYRFFDETGVIRGSKDFS